MEKFDYDQREESFARFERAAAKGHEESIWIVSVVQDVQMEWDPLLEAFAKTEKPLGWFFAGMLSAGREKFDFYEKSAEGGCSWAQVGYGGYFNRGEFVEKDEKVFAEWLEKAADQNNPQAMECLGGWFGEEEIDKEKALWYYRVASELGWKPSMYWLSRMLEDGDGCEKDWRQTAIWSAKGGHIYLFRNMLGEATRAVERGMTDDLDWDFNQLCFALGWGLYWYQYGTETWNQSDEDQAFSNRCLDYYCSCIELQQKSIFTFLLGWNRTTGGVRGPGQMIGQMVWEGREVNLVKKFEVSDGRGAGDKANKKVKKNVLGAGCRVLGWRWR
jgi:TPR repeat protein